MSFRRSIKSFTSIVRLLDEPPRISLDGKTLGQVRGNFQIGFGVTKAGTVAMVRLGTSGESP